MEGGVEGLEAQVDVLIEFGQEADLGVEKLVSDEEGGDAGEGHGVAGVVVVVVRVKPVAPLAGGKLQGAPQAVGGVRIGSRDLVAGIGEGPHAQGAVLRVGEIAGGVQAGGFDREGVEIGGGLGDVIVERADVDGVGFLFCYRIGHE